jgi:hypothetical protein
MRALIEWLDDPADRWAYTIASLILIIGVCLGILAVR